MLFVIMICCIIIAAPIAYAMVGAAIEWIAEDPVVRGIVIPIILMGTLGVTFMIILEKGWLK